MEPVTIVGAGGIGCAVGYALRAGGTAVRFVEANPAKVAAGRRDGVRVDDRPPLAAEFVPFAEWAPQPRSTVLLCTKCYDNAAVLAKLPADVNLIPIQNGFDPQLAAHGHAREGIASFVSECAADRPHTRVTRPGELHLGGRDGGTGATPAELSGAGLFRVVRVNQIAPFKYAKLMYNAAISPLAAAAGIDNGQLLSVPAARRLFFALLQENYRILSAAGVPLGKVGPFAPRTVAWILRRKWLAGLMARRFEPSLRGTYCSMAGEIAKGRTELDNYTGHLLWLADATGEPAPLNREVYDLVSGMTAARAAPGIDRLSGLGASPLAA
ncbi:ketopantoate reductase family protein [Urbifossiella limnaea]|uniref:2-dehydropantoate 2-reductase n=1 Tax=Urbifossiella limnaea TaxID=2528023 RepID=A0A517XYS0_9BACT|nr:ketopantoate reductase C-terminal domain-containing protein [Urbifossiella limnaea]QDU22649.1 2-dehydropantoate 2-reductase [Urbifossiella limnaea]